MNVEHYSSYFPQNVYFWFDFTLSKTYFPLLHIKDSREMVILMFCRIRLYFYFPFIYCIFVAKCEYASKFKEWISRRIAQTQRFFLLAPEGTANVFLFFFIMKTTFNADKFSRDFSVEILQKSHLLILSFSFICFFFLLQSQEKLNLKLLIQQIKKEYSSIIIQ